MKTRNLFLAAASLVLGASFAAPAVAAPAHSVPRDAGFMLTQARQLSLREVVEIIAAQEPGRLSDAKLVTEGGRAIYQIRWEPSREGVRGRILFFTVDAETGQILSRRGG
jgi:uncharacterized membrane protein YkoI